MTRVHEIFNDILLKTTATFEEEIYSLESWQKIFHDKMKSQNPFIVASLHDEVIGYGTYGPFRKASGYRVTVEHSLHVDEKWRGQGVGSKILQGLIQHAKRQNLWAMVAAIDSENKNSIHLHEKFGFFCAGELPAIAEKFSRSLNLTIMQLDLRKPLVNQPKVSPTDNQK